MSNKLHISEELSLPLDIITMRTALYGDSGAGKTTFARLLAEKVDASHHRFCAIDLKNDWYGLKSSADGESAGLPVVVFGGPRGDVKLFDDAAAAVSLAQTIASIDQSVIVDLDGMSRTRQEKFLAPFLDSLYESNRRPLLLFCDEADRYAPQKPMSQEAIMSLSSSEDIARRGRKRGIGSFWLTQRTAVLNKNVSEFANLTAVFRTPGEKDLKELEDRVGRIADKETVKEVMRLAPGLADGQAIFLSAHPKLRPFMPHPVKPIQLPMPWTFDSSATPSVGQRKREPKVLAQADLAAIESRMAKQVEQAKANDPAQLKRRITELERQLAARPKEQVEKTVEKIVEVPVLKNGQLDRTEKIAGRLEQAFDKLTAQADALKTESAELRRLIAPAAAPRPAPTPITRIAVGPRITATVPTRLMKQLPATGENGAAEVGRGGLRRILIALAQRQGLTNRQIGVRAGLSSGSGTFATYMGKARSEGWITDEGDKRYVTEAGVAALGDYEPLPSGSALLNYWLAHQGNSGAARMLTALAQVYPDALTNEQIGEAAGISHVSGTFATYMGKLRTLELIQSAGRGLSKASDELFD